MKSTQNFRGPSAMDMASFENNQLENVHGSAYQASSGNSNAYSISAPAVQRKLSNATDEKTLMRKEKGGGESTVSSQFQAGVSSKKGGGQQLDANMNGFMSNEFGSDFSSVKVHNDAKSNQMAQDVNARAFTVGNDIFFNKNEYQPNSKSGKKLLAHELTHVIQQRGNQTMINRKKSKEYTFNNCSDTQFKIIDQNVKQAYAMINHTLNTLITVIGLLGTAKEDTVFSADLKGILNAARIEFGANDIPNLGIAKMNFLAMKAKLMGGLNMYCHTDPKKNKMAFAEVGGKLISFGPSYFDDNKSSNGLGSRPRVMIHELGHNIGLDHVWQGSAYNAKTGETTIAQVSHGADACAVFAYRIYTKKFSGSIDKMSGI